MTELLFLLLLLSIAIIGLIHSSRFVKRLPAYLTGKLSWPELSSRLKMTLVSLALIPIFTLLMAVIAFFHSSLVKAAGNLTIEIISGYNLVVDSNVESPSSYAPSVATVAGKFCNTGDAPLTDVQTFIGDYKGGVGDTPGIYPIRDSAAAAFIAQHPHLANSGLYSFSHVGGSIGLRDAGRYIGALAPGECRIQYWHFSYPRRANPNNSGVAVWGTTNDPNDDLWLDFDVWGTAAGGVSVGTTRKATMRNEITAMANKIEPNGGVWFNTDTSLVKPGYIITSNGVRYELGVINKGFDNDGNGIYDYNAWLQPIGDPSYDPSCFRLIRTSGVLTVSRSGGNPDLIIPFTDQLYFTNLPTNNNGVIGNVYYTFMAMNGPCSTSLTPYQEVASGADNEKYNGDYGASLPPVQSSDPDVEIDKTGSATVTLGGTINYQIPARNVGTTNAGLPLSTSGGTETLPWVPLVFSDTIPAGMIYKQGSATHTFTTTGVIILYSADQGQTWNLTEPTAYSTVTNIQWWLTDTLKPGETGRVLFGITVPTTYTNSYVENCAEGSFGGGASFDQACTTTLIAGNNLIGDQVWRDDNGNGALDVGESGLANVTVQLYLDKNSSGTLDSGDLLAMATTTSITGYYTFNNLPNGNFLVQVDSADPDIPFGYSPTTNQLYAITLNNNNFLNADFGFGPSLSLDKQQLTTPLLEGQLVTYTLSLKNLRPGNGTGQVAACTYDVWANNLVAAGNDWLNPGLAVGAAGPNGTFAVADFSGNGDVLNVNGFNFSTQTGNIVSVEAIYSLYLSGTLGTSSQFDTVEGRIYTNSNLITSTTFTNSYLNNNFSGAANQKLLAWNVTGARSNWNFTDFASLSAEIYVQKVGSPDGASVNLDTVGFRVTTDQQCGSDTINPAPLTDTFDASKLQFVSATPGQSSLSTAASPYPNTGVISWTNVGPIYAGQTKVVTVVFKALELANNVTTTITNTAAVSGATFTTGEPTNSASDTVTDTLRPTASIGDYVWRDEDGDGNQDPGEFGIAGVVISLTANVTLTLNNQSYPAGTTITTTTNTNGYYLFEGLYYTGRYTVSVATVTLPTGSGTLTPTYDLATSFDPITTNNRTTFTLTPTITGSGDDQLEADFGYQLPTQIDGTIWHDWNHNGSAVQDTGEEGLAGITVTLTNGSGTVVAATTTNGSGYYSFVGNFTGTYTVTVNTASGPLATGTWIQSFDTDGLPTSHQSTASVVTGGYSQVDFSYYQTGFSDIGDTVYTDWNSDGDQDAGEEGIGGITVWLYEDTNNDGLIDSINDALVMTDTTTSTGYYLFPNLPADNFIVVINETSLPFPAGGYNQTDDPDSTFDSRSAVTTNGTTDVLSIDFGYQPSGTGSIGDFVWRDDDRDGIQDSGEPGIVNMTVSLYEDSDGDGVISPTVDALVMTTTTNAGGIYSFDNLPAGKYLVQVDTTDSDLPQDGYGQPFVLSTANNPISVSLTTGQDYLNADFGFTAGATIGNLVWRDDDRDTTADATEPGFAGVIMWLYDDLNNDGLYSITDTLVASTTTSASGIYSFTGLPAGNYIVWVDTTTTPTSTFTYDLNGILEGQAAVTLTAGQVFLGADFGLPSVNGSIGDQLWIDLDSNGIYDSSEPGVAGVVITLTTTSGTAITTTTDADGFYLFPNLVSGPYTVTVSTSDLPPGISQSFELDGTLNHQTTITLTDAENNMAVDFGYVPDLSVSKQAVGSRDPLQPGDMITYTVVLSNPSPATVTGVTISDTIPANTGFVADSLTINPSTAASLVSPAGSPPVLYVSPITLTANSPVTITFQVTVTSPLPTGVDTITNTVLMTSAGVTSTDTVTNPVAPLSADLIIIKSDSPDPVLAGGILTYTLTYTNNGSADADSVTITDTLPVSVTFGGIVNQPGTVSGPSQSGQSLVWSVGTLTATNSGSLVFTVTVDSNAPSAITNSVIITATSLDSDPTNNNDDEPTIVEYIQHVIGVVFLDLDGDGVFEPGNGETPIPSITVTITDTNGITYTLQTDTSGAYTQIVPPGSTQVDVDENDPDMPAGVTLSPGSTDPVTILVPVNGSQTIETGYVPSADLAITKSDNPDPIIPGGVLTYTLTYTNQGPGDAQSIYITDTLPASVIFGGMVSANPALSGPTQTGQLLTWYTPTLVTGAFGNVVFTVTVNSAVTQTITNSVTITATTPDSNPINNNDDEPTDIQQSDLFLDKTVNNPNPNIGEVVTFTVTISNAGPDDATGVTVSDPVPTGYSSITNISNGGTLVGSTITWNNLTIVTGSSLTLTFRAIVEATGVYTNEAQVAGVDQYDPDSTANNGVDTDNDGNSVDDPGDEDDGDGAVVTPQYQPGLAVDKSVNIARVAPHQVVTYTIRITNTGDVTINPVRVTDTLDMGLTYQTGTANPAPNIINGQQLVWNDVTGGKGLTPGANTQITLLAAVTTTVGTYGNLVVVDGGYPGGTTPPVTDTVSTVIEDPGVDLDKQMSAPGVVGDLITFTIRITNTGPSTLDQIPLFDSFTGPIQYVGGTPQANTIDQVNKLLAWNDLTTFFGNLPPGQSIVVTTVFRLTTTDTEFSMANVARVNGADDVFNNQANNAQDTVILSNIPTAIELLYFTSQQVGGSVELRWATAVEYDNYGFRLLRSTSGSMANAVEIGFMPGLGQGTVSGTTYTFMDTSVLASQTYTYWLVDVDLNGIETAHSETTSISINAGGGGTILYLPLILN